MKRTLAVIAVLALLYAWTARSQTNISQPSPVNVTQVGGATLALGSTTMSASIPHVNATNQANPCLNPNATLTTLAGATSGTSATQLIALIASKQIFVCQITLTAISGTSPTYKLEYGTGTACASGTTALVGPSAASVAGSIFSYPNSFIVPASNALCYLNGGTTPIYDYAIVYVQQ